MRGPTTTAAVAVAALALAATTVNADDTSRYIEQAAVRDAPPFGKEEPTHSVIVIHQSGEANQAAPFAGGVRQADPDYPVHSPIIVNQSGEPDFLWTDPLAVHKEVTAHTLIMILQHGKSNATGYRQAGTRNILTQVQDGRWQGRWWRTNGLSDHPFAVYDASPAIFQPPHGASRIRQSGVDGGTDLTARVHSTGPLNFVSAQQYGAGHSLRGLVLPGQPFAQAGRANVLKAQQGRKQAPQAGNRLQGRQTGASNATFALQDGSFNTATVNQRMTARSTAHVLQKRWGNRATIQQALGSGNSARVVQLGSNNEAEIRQIGAFNAAHVTQDPS